MKIKIVYAFFLSLFFMNNITAQVNQPYVRIAKIVVDSAQLENYKEQLTMGMKTAIRIEPGVLSMYAVYDNLQPTHITILETYSSKEAYQSHIQTDHFKKYKSGTLNMVKSLELVDVTPIEYAIKGNQ
jgi:quinol monooxygenase YgiN